MTIATGYEECLEQGITLFNEGKFFEAHEAWEPYGAARKCLGKNSFFRDSS